MDLFDYYEMIQSPAGRADCRYPVVSRAALARAAGMSPCMLSRVITGERKCPARYAYSIEQALGGAVTRKDLLPDTWHFYWPDIG